MPSPRDITSAIYKSRKLKTRALIEPSSHVDSRAVETRRKMRRMAFSSFTVGVGLVLVIALFSQVLLMTLFSWL